MRLSKNTKFCKINFHGWAYSERGRPTWRLLNLIPYIFCTREQPCLSVWFMISRSQIRIQHEPLVVSGRASYQNCSCAIQVIQLRRPDPESQTPGIVSYTTPYIFNHFCHSWFELQLLSMQYGCETIIVTIPKQSIRMKHTYANQTNLLFRITCANIINITVLRIFPSQIHHRSWTCPCVCSSIRTVSCQK